MSCQVEIIFYPPGALATTDKGKPNRLIGSDTFSYTDWLAKKKKKKSLKTSAKALNIYKSSLGPKGMTWSCVKGETGWLLG